VRRVARQAAFTGSAGGWIADQFSLKKALDAKRWFSYHYF
jgi:hypothetical protein